MLPWSINDSSNVKTIVKFEMYGTVLLLTSSWPTHTRSWSPWRHSEPEPEHGELREWSILAGAECGDMSHGVHCVTQPGFWRVTSDAIITRAYILNPPILSVALSEARGPRYESNVMSSTWNWLQTLHKLLSSVNSLIAKIGDKDSSTLIKQASFPFIIRSSM